MDAGACGAAARGVAESDATERLLARALKTAPSTTGHRPRRRRRARETADRAGGRATRTAPQRREGLFCAKVT